MENRWINVCSVGWMVVPLFSHLQFPPICQVSLLAKKQNYGKKRKKKKQTDYLSLFVCIPETSDEISINNQLIIYAFNRGILHQVLNARSLMLLDYDLYICINLLCNI